MIEEEDNGKDFTFIFSVDLVTERRDKRVLVLINPASGAGKAQRLVMEHAIGVWSEAELSYQIVLTGLIEDKLI